MRQLLFIVIASLFATGAHAAELQLREEVRTPGPLVLLGDLADIHARHSVEAAELATIDVMPLPAAGEKRVLRLREIQDLLAVRGVNLASHRFSGASQTTIHGPKLQQAVAPRQMEAPRGTTFSAKVPTSTVVEKTRAAIEAHLNDLAGEQGWKVTLQLSDERAARIMQLGDALVVDGNKELETGKQPFKIGADNSEAPPVTVTATVTLPPAIVVARNSLPKGVILRADDVELKRGLPTKGEAEVYQSIDDVVGKETTRVVTEGQILDSRSVRRQLLVRKNEVVTLYARAAGVCVRTTVRVRDDGAAGDLVTVETLDDRKPMFARVTGPQEVEVFAQAVTAAEPTQHATR